MNFLNEQVFNVKNVVNILNYYYLLLSLENKKICSAFMCWRKN
jgi:hypothetical protein